MKFGDYLRMAVSASLVAFNSSMRTNSYKNGLLLLSTEICSLVIAKGVCFYANFSTTRKAISDTSYGE